MRTVPAVARSLLLTSGLGHRTLLGKHHDFALRARPLGLHRTMAFEPRAVVHDQDVRSQIAQHLGGEPKFDALAGGDVAADLARHDDRRRLDGAAHHGALPNHNAVLGNDLTVNLAVDLCWPLEVELAPDLGALAQIGAAYVPSFYTGAIYTGLRDKERAFQWLKRAYDERCDYMIHLPKEPATDPLRSDPRFDALVPRPKLTVDE